MTAIPLDLYARPTVTIVDVTPELAQRWLDANTHNRNIRPNLVNGYARDMEAGNWAMTGEALKFSADGTLLDGQHRLLAVVRSGVTVRMLVIEGLAVHAQNFMDSGAKRQVADALKLNGYANATTLAAAARLGLFLASGRPATRARGGFTTFTNSEVEQFIAENQDLLEAVKAAQAHQLSIEAHTSVMAYVWWRCAKVSRKATEEFFYALANHETHGKGDPRSALIKRLASARRKSERLSQAAQVSLFLRSWNAWRRGQKLSSLPIESRYGTIQIPNPR